MTTSPASRTDVWCSNNSIASCVAPRHEKKPVAVALADLDHFKGINDAHGHSAGDAVLRQVARCLQLELREYDCIGRYGGEEFFFVLPGCDDEEAQAAMDAVREARGRHAGALEWPATADPTISIGISWTKPGGLTATELANTADEGALSGQGAGGRRSSSRSPARR